MVGTPVVQQDLELGGSDGDLRGQLPGYVQMPWKPMGPQELPPEDR